MVQKIMYNELAEGVVGDFYDNSPRRVDGYILKNIDGSKASGSITLTSNPTANNTITIGAEVYKFVVSASSDFDVVIGTTKEKSAENLATVINTLSKIVDATVVDNKVDVVAKENGEAGNGLVFTTSNSTDITIVSFTGGQSEVKPTVAKVFTKNNNVAVQGGDGVYLGILVNSKEYVNEKNLETTLQVANGSQGSICSMGRVFVKVNNDVNVGYVVAFDNKGNIYGYENEASVPNNQRIIKNSQFIINDAVAGKLAIVELN